MPTPFHWVFYEKKVNPILDLDPTPGIGIAHFPMQSWRHASCWSSTVFLHIVFAKYR